MSSQSRNARVWSRKIDFTVCGYIRDNFDKKCWIDEVTAIIIKFYAAEGGSLYMCGNGKYGKLGIKEYKNKTCKKPTLCAPFHHKNAFKVSVSDYHTLIIDTKGNVWCCGAGEEGQLGNGKTVFVPTKLNLNSRVIAVSAGVLHSLFLCENGTVKGCGSNKSGQIGLGDLKKTETPKTIEKLENYKIVQISAGSYNSAVLTEDGALFCFGKNRCGNCGVGQKRRKKVKIPTKVDLNDEIKFVDCGSNHTLLITYNGMIHSFGEGDYYKLGRKKQQNKWSPTLIWKLKGKRIKMCAAGGDHSLCIDDEGMIWSFGDNEEGQCGVSRDIREQTKPKVIEWFTKNNIKGKECFAGGDASSIIATDGSLYLFGSNFYHQLGLKEKDRYFTPTKPFNSQNMTVQSISMRYYHTAIICRTP